MRIVQVTNTYYPEFQFGGPPEKIHALSEGLQRRGHHVRVVTFLSSDRRARRVEIADGVPVRYLPWFGWGLRQWPGASGDLLAEIRQADIVHCYGLYNFLCPLAAKFARRLARPFLLEPLGMFVPRGGRQLFKRIFHACFTRPMAASAAALVATSPPELEELKALASADRLLLRRNGVDVAGFQNLPAAGAFRQRLGLPPSARLVLYLGRLSPIKNLEQLVQAFALARLPSTHLALVGPALEPDYARRLASLRDSLDLTTSVALPGPLYGREKLEALADADLFVLPSLNESFGNAAAEAVAAGVPVLLTETCGIAPLIHRRAGLAVPLGAESLAEGLRLLLDSSTRAPLVADLHRVAAELSWEQPLDQTEQFYRNILKRPDREN